MSEYQAIAAVLCSDIDILATVAEMDSWSKDDLKELIFRLKKQKDLLITDDKHRKMRYNAMQALFNTGQNT